MNKLTKLMLASAMMITSGFAADSNGSLMDGELIVNGTFVQNEKVEIDGNVTVGAGGTVVNKAEIKFNEESSLKIAQATTKETFSKWNKTYKLGVFGEKYIAIKFADGKGYYNETATNDWEVAKDWTNTKGVSASDLATAFRMYMYSNLEVGVTVDSEDTSVVNFVNGDTDTSECYNVQFTEYFGNAEAYAGNSGFFAFYEPGEGTKVYRPEEFAANVKSAAAAKAVDDSFTDAVKAQIAAALTVGGSFDNEYGTINLTDATGTDTFKGTIQGGEVNLSDLTTGTFSNLILDTVTVGYSYNSADTYSAPDVNTSSYIVVTSTKGKTEGQAKTDCADKFSPDSKTLTINASNRGESASDERLTFADMLADKAKFNKSGVKMKTSEISTIVKDYASALKLNADAAIIMQLEGVDGLTFATGISETSGQVIEFAGDQSKYTGVASFDSGINVVRASAPNALPVKLMEDMSSITLEISGGENKVENENTTVNVKTLKINSGAKFIIGAKTTFESGVSGK